MLTNRPLPPPRINPLLAIMDICIAHTFGFIPMNRLVFNKILFIIQSVIRVVLFDVDDMSYELL